MEIERAGEEKVLKHERSGKRIDNVIVGFLTQRYRDNLRPLIKWDSAVVNRLLNAWVWATSKSTRTTRTTRMRWNMMGNWRYSKPSICRLFRNYTIPGFYLRNHRLLLCLLLLRNTRSHARHHTCRSFAFWVSGDLLHFAHR
jgi:hypothetical protein